jgi:peptide/nickel transport system substrate-binding protein
MTIVINSDIANFDPYYSGSLMNIEASWMEKLFVPDWTLNPSVFAFNLTFVPPDYIAGSLAQNWEFTTPNTFVVNLRQGIYWQDLSPANGREFVASDVVYDWDRIYGLGDGFTTPSPYAGGLSANLISITATGTYQVTFGWNISNPEYIMVILMGNGNSADMECPDALQQWGNLTAWQHAIGTGPFMLTDFVDGSSATLTKNPNYWGYDERYPQNQLPYINSMVVLIIPNSATALAALRTGKVDELDGNSLQTAQGVGQTNPSIEQIGIPSAHGMDVDPRNDVAPFNNLQVREALQMSINLPAIAQSYYDNSAEPYPDALTSYYMTGWGYPYSQWSSTLQAQYTYNTTEAKQLLAQAGYPNGFTTDVVANSAADLDLLEIVQSDFAAINVTLNINLMASAAWTSYVSNNHSQDAMSYNTLGFLGLTYQPFLQCEDFLKGNSTDYIMVNDPAFNAFYPEAVAETSVDDIKQVVQAANEEVAQQHFVISLLQPVTFSLYQPWLKGYNGQSQSIWGTNGPKYLGFFAARFWIDKSS